VLTAQLTHGLDMQTTGTGAAAAAPPAGVGDTKWGIRCTQNIAFNWFISAAFTCAMTCTF